MKNEHGLTPQREVFATTLAGGKVNQSEAYRAAFKCARMTAKQIHEEASKLAADPKVRQRITGLQALAADKAVLDATEIMTETRRIALSDIGGIIGVKEGKTVILMPNELDAATRAAIKTFKIDDLGRIEYQFWDKNVSLERAAKLLGLFEKDNGQKADALATLLSGLQGNVIGAVPGAATFGPVADPED